ncbi:MAG TPA: hypothetical protein PLD59_04015, partial [Tepidisphaeraceae bacterium]|nr:hypothetical protein [Tepidisphaeraceae bacterium]
MATNLSERIFKLEVRLDAVERRLATLMPTSVPRQAPSVDALLPAPSVVESDAAASKIVREADPNRPETALHSPTTVPQAPSVSAASVMTQPAGVTKCPPPLPVARRSAEGSVPLESSAIGYQPKPPQPPQITGDSLEQKIGLKWA